MVRDVVVQLLATDVALDKLGAREISPLETEQLARNRHVIIRNPRDPSDEGKRVLLAGTTDGGRALTLVLERTIEPRPGSWSRAGPRLRLSVRLSSDHDEQRRLDI